MARTMTLVELGLTARRSAGQADDAAITGLALDSRAVAPGDLFGALPGSSVHGAEHARTAIGRGAVAVLTDMEGARRLGDISPAALIVAEDARQAFARAAALWFGPQPETVVAVTGTNGKTSVASFCRQIWTALGHQAVNLGTTGVEGAWAHPLCHTTPDALTLHRVLAEARRAGVTHVAMEASSHGLDQRRLDGVSLAAAAFTNFTQDHLDYHGTFAAYFEAKMGLFDRVLPHEGVAVINLDDPQGPLVADRVATRGQEVIGTGTAERASLRLLAQRFDATGQEIRLSWQGAARQVRLDLVGGFQASNALVAAGLAIGAGEDPEAVLRALPTLRTVRGRMQLAATRSNGAQVFVDFAHTPDAIATALAALRPHVMGRIVAIIGAGGDRDRVKRPLMGAAASAHADIVIVTDDNPRSEDPAAIRAAVLAGTNGGATEIGDRAEAILRGVDVLGPGDSLLICGKGHETGQIVGGDIFPFDDVEQASVSVAVLERKP